MAPTEQAEATARGEMGPALDAVIAALSDPLTDLIASAPSRGLSPGAVLIAIAAVSGHICGLITALTAMPGQEDNARKTLVDAFRRGIEDADTTELEAEDDAEAGNGCA